MKLEDTHVEFEDTEWDKKSREHEDFVCLSVEIEKSSFLELEKLHHELG